MRALHGSWAQQDELLALIAELIDYNNRLLLAIHTKPGTRLVEPLRIPRPYEANGKSTPQGTSIGDTAALERIFGPMNGG